MKKIYNKIKVFAIVLMATLMMNSCDSWLELYPEGQTLLEDYWKSADDIESVLATCYLSMMEANYLQRAVVWGELRSDNMEKGQKASAEQLDILDVNLQATNSYCDWAAFYQTINYCNTVIHYAPQVMEEDENLSASMMESYRAEARAIRAMSYFYLVRTFGDVPLVWKPTIDDSEGFDIAKSDADSVLNVLVDDLREALIYAQSTYGSNKQDYNKSRFTKQSIRVLLADILLWQGRYQECVDVCDEFLRYNETQIQNPYAYYELIPAGNMLWMYVNPMTSSSADEVIFATAFLASAMSNPVPKMYGVTFKDPQIAVSEALVANDNALFRANDERIYLKNGPSTSSGDERFYQIVKYVSSGYTISGGSAQYSTFSDTKYEWIFYRLPDVYLIRAEALVELAANEANKDEADDCLNHAIHMVNKTYMRANTDLRFTDSLSVVNYSTVDAMRQLVMDERRREFMFEGKRWFDIVRQSRRANDAQVAVDYLSNKRFPNSSSHVALSKMSTLDALYIPIYQKEIENNKLLKQNPFYQMDETTAK